jgi:hypothetical protein
MPDRSAHERSRDPSPSSRPPARCATSGGQPYAAPHPPPSVTDHPAPRRCSATTDISDVILDLAAKQAQLSQLIDACFEALDPRTIPDLARLLALHGQNASRIGRLLRDRQALSSETTDELTEAIDAALDELTEGWQIDL